MLGSQLMEAIKKEFEGFQPIDYGATSLRDFLNRFVPEVEPVGKQGMDSIYALGTRREGITNADSVPGTSPPVSESKAISGPDSSIWKTFASPNTPYRLFANKQTGGLEVRRPGAPPPGDEWVNIPSMPAQEHLELAREYLAHVDEGLRARLEATLAHPRWWVPFYAEILECRCTASWNDLRRRHIVSALKKALEGRGIPSDSVEAQLRAKNVGTQPQPPGSSDSRLVPFGPTPARKPRIELRHLAAAIVSGMSVGELRELRVRLGDVFDALER